MRTRGQRRRIPVAMLVSVVAIAIVASTGPGFAAGDFYAPPAPLPQGSPGDLIKSEPMSANALPGVPVPARAWRIMYQTTSATGEPIPVTGTVLVPRTPWTGPGTRPIVGHAVGTQGLADRCAPSRQWSNGTEYESAEVGPMLARGWAVAVTDMPGLGTPGNHPYVVGRTNGLAVLDAVRAARNLDEAGLDPEGPAAIYGYSEGGNTASWAIQLQPTYAPDIPLQGAAVGSVPSDFPALMEFHEGGQFAFLLLYGAIGFDAAYPELQLDSYLNERGRAAREELEDTCIQEAIAFGFANPKHIADYTTSNPMTAPQWRTRLDQNYLGTIAPRSPVLVGSGISDEAIPYEQTRGLYERWCERGADAHFVQLPSVEHLIGAGAFLPIALQFLAARFAGEPLPKAEDCVAGAGAGPTPEAPPSPKPKPKPDSEDSDDQGDDSDDDDADASGLRDRRHDGDPVVPVVILGGIGDRGSP